MLVFGTLYVAQDFTKFHFSKLWIWSCFCETHTDTHSHRVDNFMPMALQFNFCFQSYKRIGIQYLFLSPPQPKGGGRMKFHNFSWSSYKSSLGCLWQYFKQPGNVKATWEVHAHLKSCLNSYIFIVCLNSHLFKRMCFKNKGKVGLLTVSRTTK